MDDDGGVGPLSASGPRKALKPGDMLGRYTLVRRLATGGMAEVFVARYAGIGEFEREAVVKCVLPHLARDARYIEMFLREASLAARLTHPNVCPVFDVGEQDGRHFLAMDYLDGVPLGEVIEALRERGRPTDPRLAAALISDAAEGLHHAHEARGDDGHLLGLVHRDVTPANLFVTSAGVVRILDFGVAKASLITNRTDSGVLKGTYEYMAPEQLKSLPTDRRADVFSLAVVAAELLSRRPIFHRDTEYLISLAITEEPLPSVRAFAPETPDALADAIDAAMARDREARTPTARALGRAVLEAVRPLGGRLAPLEVAELLDELCPASRRSRATFDGHDVIDVDTDAGVAPPDGLDLRATLRDARSPIDELTDLDGAATSPHGARALPRPKESKEQTVESLRPIRTPLTPPLPSRSVPAPPAPTPTPPPVPPPPLGPIPLIGLASQPPTAPRKDRSVTLLAGAGRKRLWAALGLALLLAGATAFGVQRWMARGGKAPEPASLAAATRPPDAAPSHAAPPDAAPPTPTPTPTVRDAAPAIVKPGEPPAARLKVTGKAGRPVLIDGKKAGVTPLDLAMRPGRHVVKIGKARAITLDMVASETPYELD